MVLRGWSEVVWGGRAQTACVAQGRGAATGPENVSPEEEAQGTHLAQVHSEHTADLLQGTCPLRLIPAWGPKVSVGTKGRARGGGTHDWVPDTGHGASTCSRTGDVS